MRPRRKPGTTFRWARRLLASLTFFNFPNPDVPEAHFVAVILQVQGRTIMSVYLGRTDPFGRAFNLNVVLKDRKSTRLNSSHVANSHGVFCLKKKKNNNK